LSRLAFRLSYPESVPNAGESVASRAAAAAARTVATGTARLLAAECSGSPLPEEPDWRCEGVADLAARRCSVLKSFLNDRVGAGLLPGQIEMIYDGANAYIKVGGSWTGFFLGDPSGPRRPDDPLWPLDALSGASGDAVQIAPEAVRGVPATHYGLTVDLARADAALATGVSGPSGPYRPLGRLQAGVWLDAAGLARRISVRTGAAGEQRWLIVELWDFGVAVDISPPGPGEVLPPREAYKIYDDTA
jgi:hypothetical protein